MVKPASELAVGIVDRRRSLRLIDDDRLAEDEPARSGLLHEPHQRSLRQRIACVPAAYVRVAADEPALLDVLDRAFSSTHLPVFHGPGPERRVKILAVLVESQCVERVFVVETQVRVQEPVFVDLGFGAGVREAHRADGVPDADEFDLRRPRILRQPPFLEHRVLRRRLAEQRADRRRFVQPVPRVKLLDRERRPELQDAALADQAREAPGRVRAAAEAEDEDIVACFSKSGTSISSIRGQGFQ